MVTYIQIGKNPRMAVNSTVKDIRSDFIEQIPSWRTLVPIYFYSSSKAKEYTGVLLPYRWERFDKQGYLTNFFWLGQYEAWKVHSYGLRKVHVGTVEWSHVLKVKELYRKKGFVL